MSRGNDPVKSLSAKYPRVLVIKAMMEMMKENREIDEDSLERKIISFLKEKKNAS